VSEAELDALMARLSDGDRTAFDPLFEALAPRARRAAGRFLSPDRADDVAQTALERVFFRASEFEAGRPVLPWFYAIVLNEIRSARRKRAGEPLPETLLDEGVSPEDALAARELAIALDRAIESLDAVSAEAIAVMLGRAAPLDIAAPTFRKRCSRAVARLRSILGGSHG
jgi:RNA polymerase sigma-70 factor (ECF subfamily)